MKFLNTTVKCLKFVFEFLVSLVFFAICLFPLLL